MVAGFLDALETVARGGQFDAPTRATQVLLDDLSEARTSAVTRGQAPSEECLVALRLHASRGADEPETVAAQIGLAWVSCFDGSLSSEELGRWCLRAQHTRSPALWAEAASLRAVHAALAHRAERVDGEALKWVRLASRMTRTEAMPPFELLANLALARMRRLDGHPHLCARILLSLSRRPHASSSGWLSWELVMCGSPPMTMEGDFGAGANALGRALMQISTCNRVGFLSLLEEAEERTRHPGFREDVERVRTAFDPRWSHPSEFRRGTGGLPPDLRSLTSVQTVEGAHRAVLVVGPTRAPTRLLSQGGRFESHATKVCVAAPRTATALAVLASAGDEGIDKRTFFKEVYRFEYEGEKHRAALAVLLHRARAELGASGSIEQHQERLRLECFEDMLIPDPRCASDPSERVLALVADGEDSAQSIATTAHLPLRSVQEILRQLVDDGACVRERKGRAFSYVVEDTTFCEPTNV